MAMFGSSKLQFLFVCEQKQLARVLPESSAVICAKFSGVSTSFTATITKCFKKFFAAGVPRNERSRVLGVPMLSPPTNIGVRFGNRDEVCGWR